MTAQMYGSPPTSQTIAAEVRAEVARRGMSMRQFAEVSGLDAMWLSRRCGKSPKVAMTLEDVALIASKLGTTNETNLSFWLPRLDSNQQPSGFAFPQVSAA